MLLPVVARNYCRRRRLLPDDVAVRIELLHRQQPDADGTYVSLRFGRGSPEFERLDATELAEHAVGRTLTPAEVSSYWTGRAIGFITVAARCRGCS